MYIYICIYICIYIIMYIIQIMVKFVTWIFLDGPHPPSSDPSNNEPSWICTEPPHNPGKRKPPVKSNFSSWGEGL